MRIVLILAHIYENSFDFITNMRIVLILAQI